MKKRSKYRKLNIAQCLKCQWILMSLSRHDFKMCECGEFTDGGFDYCRRTTGLRDLNWYEKTEVS